MWIGNIYEEKGGKTLFHVFAGSEQVCTFETNSPLYGGSDSSKVGDYYHQDQLTSSSVLSDSSGNQTEVNAYFPFGRTQTASPQAGFQVSRRFTGQILDAETGLYYYNFRYYDPELGRFIQPDDRIPDFSNPQSYNRYSYCLNNPLRYTDPDGHGFWSSVGDTLFSAGTYTSSYQLMVMHDSFGWKMVEIPVAIGGMTIATADNVLTAVSLGGEGVVKGGIKGVLKVGEEALGKEGEKAGAKIVTDAGKTAAEKEAANASKIDRTAFRTEREEFWKSEAKNNPGQYSPENLERMKQGKAPIGPDGYPMELHHVNRTPEGGTKPMTRTDHRLGPNYKKNHPPTE